MIRLVSEPVIRLANGEFVTPKEYDENVSVARSTAWHGVFLKPKY